MIDFKFPSPTRLQPELELLVACCRAANDRITLLLRCSGSQFNWDLFYDLAAIHGVRSHALHGLSLSNTVAIPEPIQAALRQYHRDRVARDLHLTAKTLQLTRELLARGIATIVLKGCAISNTLYQPNSELRHFTDIDLLVAPGDFNAAEAYLRKQGYLRSSPKFEPSGASSDMVDYLMHAHTYYHCKTGVGVDLHRRLTENPFHMNIEFREIFDSAVTIKLTDGEIKSLGTEVLTPYLCCHALGHGFIRLSWIVDVAKVFDQVSADQAARIFNRAKAFGADRYMLLVSRVVTNLYGAETPFSRFIAPRQRWAIKSETVLSRLSQVKKAPHRRTLRSILTELSYLALNIRLSSHSRAKIHNFASLLCDPRDTLVLRRGRQWLPLYLIVGPFLALGRFVQRGPTRWLTPTER